MDTRRGIFIVIEGTDGSGKGTQFKLLREHLEQAGYDVAAFDFPQYESPSSYFVRRYLNGDFGTIDEVGPYTSSLFYALDRYEAAPRIREALEAGKVVISNRFTGSSMGHQGTKFANPEERRGYFIWLDNLEFEMLRIPRPDMSFVLRVPADIAQSLVDQKETRSYTDKKRDLHEADLGHLERAVAVYDDLTQLFPKDFQRIDCVRDNQLLPIEAVQELIWQKVLPLLPEPPSAKPVTTQAPQEEDRGTPTNGRYFTPEHLSPEVSAYYKAAIDFILTQHAKMLQSLTSYIAATDATPAAARDANWQERVRERAATSLKLLQPVASQPDAETIVARHQASNQKITNLAHEHLPANHASEVGPVQLTDFWPRNEIDLVADMLYENSSLPLMDIRRETSAWPYNRKLDIFEAYTEPTMVGQAFRKAGYSWDILSDYASLEAIQSTGFADGAEHQLLTPRYGYEVPKIVEDAGLSDQFEDCFDRSLALYSYLQNAGHPQEAQYATLLGHRLRWKITWDAKQLHELFKLQDNEGFDPAARALLQIMKSKLAEAHPLLTESLAENK